MSAMICESPSFRLVHELLFPTFGPLNPQDINRGEHRFSSFSLP